ncbi:MAG TPA: L-threonylcarbamoyladenylate synthase [Pirellulales bacterium]|nr:L-threonylcarbamoyladenylate synthase [Pirellulales bacterium]
MAGAARAALSIVGRPAIIDHVTTIVLPVDPQLPDPTAIARAAAVLRAGGLVVFPTETVYGLGANALDVEAVAGIYRAKGRPATNPLIVHVGTIADAQRLATTWPAAAEKLAERFWPGPLTIVLPKTSLVPETTTAGGATVALRMPSHPVARALLAASGVPLAAPSANTSTGISSTTAQHVLKTLNDRVDMVLDGGACPGGLESTVLDLSGEHPRLLRPGLIGVAELEAVLGTPIRVAAEINERQPAPSPGMMPRHYAPTVPLECVEGDATARVAEHVAKGLRVGWIVRQSRKSPQAAVVVALRNDVAGYSAALYSALHELESAAIDRIVVEMPPDESQWLAVRDRLRRASCPP